jgi:Zn-dependent M28 family amino/carboxypeptidase
MQPELANRIMISCHWDTRPFSDRDLEKPKARFDGAVDGAASAGIMLEIARILKSKPATVGVDFVFFDAEDYGNPSDGNTYCLGSQYFAARPPFTDNFPKFGINLDMVAAQSATFYREGYSMQYASDIVFKVWDIAAELGHQNTFVPENSGAITDDHFFINSILGIKTIDVIHHDPSTETGFGSYWHTQKDNMDAVNKNTMQIVGQTLLGVVYSEKPDA